MSAELIAVEGLTIDHAAGSVISGGTFVVTSVASTVAKCAGSGIYRGPLTYAFSGGNAAGFVPGTVATVAPGTIDPTATHVTSEALAVMREGDAGTMAAVGTISPPAVPPTGPVTGGVEITDAGQTGVTAK